MDRRHFLLATAALGSGAMLSACGGGGSGTGPAPDPGERAPLPQTNAALAWNQTAIEAIRRGKPGPPMAARSLAIVHGAMYDAWTAFHDRAVSATPGAPARRPPAERTAAHRMAAASFAAHAALLDQFPGQQSLFDGQLAALGLAPASNADANSTEAIGMAAAQAMLSLCHADGANQLGTLTASGVPYADYTGYVCRNAAIAVSQATPLAAIADPGHWQPLSYIDAAGHSLTPAYVGACWPQVKPFALASAGALRPAPPAQFGSAAFVAQAQHIVDLQAALTERHKVIAEYWADGPNSELPPGHWCLFGQYLSVRDGHGNDDDIKMFYALSNALFDAGVAAWDAKRFYDSARPITAIRYLMHGQTVSGYAPGAGGALRLGPVAGEAWTPFQPVTFPTPPFPEHVSGHSTFSAAAADVLRRFTHSDRLGYSYVKLAGTLAVQPGLPVADLTLSWASLSDAAAEAGLSRLYGGIHFDNANSAGQELGRQVGALVYAKAEKLWSGISVS